MPKALSSIPSLIAIVLGISGVLLVLYAWQLPPFRSAIATTNDAYVRGQVTILSPQIAGDIAEVPVQDFQAVHAGDLIVKIDDRIFRRKLEQACANLAQQKAALDNAEQDRLSAEARVRSAQAGVEGAKTAMEVAESNWKRVDRLLTRGVSSQSEADQRRLELEQARAALGKAAADLEVAKQDLTAVITNRQSLQAAVENAEATVRLAEIDLDNTRITAPRDGHLGEVGARVGQYVSAGTQLVALVPDRVWVVANFKETQLAGMRVGQPVSFTVDALGHARLSGRIERFAPATGSEFSVLRPDNATGNFTKVAQRLPVRIQIDPDQPLADRLAPGMSVVASVDTSVQSGVIAATAATAGHDGPQTAMDGASLAVSGNP